MFTCWKAALLTLLIFAPGEAALAGGQVFRDCSDCPEMVEIPAGNFLMGSSPAETKQDVNSSPNFFYSLFERFFLGREQPLHSVTITRSFALGKYPVTREEFAVFVGRVPPSGVGAVGK